MAYHSIILICGCGEAHSCDPYSGVEFMRICDRCGSEFHIKANVPKEHLADPSRNHQGK